MISEAKNREDIGKTQAKGDGLMRRVRAHLVNMVLVQRKRAGRG